MSLEIIATGVYLPTNVRNNEFFLNGQFYDYDTCGIRSDEGKLLREDKIVKNTGILQRRISDIDVDKMGLLAARETMKCADMARLKGIVGVTVSQNTPPLASKIALGLGLSYLSFTYDLNNACAGFSLGLEEIDYMPKEAGDRFMIVASERIIPLINEDD